VLLAEPPQSPYDLHFSVLGIPVRVHPLFWAVALLFGLSGNQKPVDMLFWVGTVFVSILVHEMGHALAARSYGWQPRITLHSFGGLASYHPTFHNTRSQILITAAGPGAGFLFAGLIIALVALAGHRVVFGWQFGLLPFRYEGFESDQLNMLIGDLLYVNIFWGLVNLLPVYPLDGGQISRELFALVSPADSVRQSLWLSVITAAAVAVLAFTRLNDKYIALFFAYLAYTSYTTLQAFGAGGGRYR
jgi:stage IV sporulation protein FB